MTGDPGFAGAAARWAGERPEAPAIVAADRTWTWHELDPWASAIAAAVDEAATPSGRTMARRVAVEPPMTAAGVAALHGVALAGAQAVLVPPRWSAMETDALLADVRPVLLLHARDADAPPGVTAVDVRTLLGTAPDRRVSADAAPRSGGELVVPTSGTTARPRLARLPLDRIDASVAAWRAVLPPATGWLLSLGLAHVAGIGIVARAAAAGVPVIVPPVDEALLASLGRPDVSHVSLVATQLARVLDALADGPPPPGLRCVLLGGGPIPEALLARALDAGWPVWPSYGATESASGVAAAAPEDARLHPWSAGVALPGVELRVVVTPDPTVGALAAAAAPVPGELHVRGPMVFAGYLDDPAATAARLTADGWLRTGDLATLDAAGRLRIADRIDDLIISGGENVAPAEVEAALAGLPGVREVAVVGIPDPEWGQVPVAVVVPQPGRDPLDQDLLAAAYERLAGFRRPRRILRAAALPRGGAEKLLRRALRRPAATAAAVPLPGGGDRGLDLETRVVLADDGQPLLLRATPRVPGDDRPAILLLHATLSSSAQLLRLAVELAPFGRVLLLDRRGSGGSRMAAPAPVPIARHVGDVADALAASGETEAVVVGHSFGGVVGLELAARRPELVRALVAWEPPYLPLAAEGERELLIEVAALVERAHAANGPSGAARAFMDLVSPGAWEQLRPIQQEALGAAGDGVLADAAMPDLDPDGLCHIAVPVVLGTGGASEPFYAPIAAGVAARIPGATVRALPDLRHFAPIVTAGPVADLVRPFLSAVPSTADPSSPPQELLP